MAALVHTAAPEEAVELASSLCDLLRQLSDRASALTPSDVAARLEDDRVRVVVATQDDHLVGTATLTTFITLTDGPVGHVEDVVVATAARGSGIGRLLMGAVHDEARRMNLAYLELTSRPAREAANALYASLGYTRRDTNVYRLLTQT